jgi:hypothetical protein
MSDSSFIQIQRIKMPLKNTEASFRGFELSQPDLAIRSETVAAGRTARRLSRGGTTSNRTTVIIHQITSFLLLCVPRHCNL